MVRLRDEEWLHLAKSLCVGETRRFRHGRERRENLVVSNEAARYAVYCNACKTGGIVDKEHVRLSDVRAPKDSEALSLPHDMHMLGGQLHSHTALGVAAFLALRGMDFMYLPPLSFSPSRKRILIPTSQGWLGRDTTNRSPQKWVTYNHQTYLSSGVNSPLAVVVEDPFSFYKTIYAVNEGAAIYSSLGTHVSPELAMRLLAHDRVIFMYDDDEAGRKGATKEAARFRAFGLHSHSINVGGGRDPKDLTIQEIQECLNLTTG